MNCVVVDRINSRGLSGRQQRSVFSTESWTTCFDIGIVLKTYIYVYYDCVLKMTLCLNHDEKWLVFIGDLVGFPKVRLGLTSR